METVVTNPSFWVGRRVFLTGHTGFKGGWLSLWLQSLGAHVTGYALAPEPGPSLFEVASVGHGMHSVIGDIRDLPSLAHAMHSAAPEVVIHMAAQALVRLSYDDPVATYQTNVMGTIHVLEAVRQCPSVRAVVNVTTDKCYENREWVWGYRESEAMGGHDPYSSSKGCAELVTAAWRRSFLSTGQTALASARAGNVIGGGDWARDRLVPDILRAFKGRAPAEVRNPASTRPWQHVLEPLSGYLLLAQSLIQNGQRHAEAWNFGPEEHDARPVSWIAERMSALWGEGSSWACTAQGVMHHEARTLKLDCAKARAELGWTSRWPLEQALQRIVAWHRAWLRGADMRRHCHAEIADFIAKRAR